jgi:nitroreductase
MDALDALHKRVSVSKLVEPAPNDAQRDAIFKAALRAADHGRLCPWRFLVIEGVGLTQLGELFCEAALSDDPALVPEICDSYRKMPLRAPMIVVVIARCQPNPKVPDIEQVISAGAAAQNMITAAYAMGLGAVWKTGAMAYHPRVIQGLGLGTGESIVGYLYMGTPISPMGAASARPLEDFFARWPAQ